MPEPIRDWNQRYVDSDTPWDSGTASEELVRLLDEFKIDPCRVLELGCGTGTNAVYLAGRGFDVTAVDISPLAIDKAKQRATGAGVNVDFRVADLTGPPDALSTSGPFPLVFDRGVYHTLRREHLDEFLATVSALTASGSQYIILAGNANDPGDPDDGPPRVHDYELCRELGDLFTLRQLREFYFDGVVIDGRQVGPLGWSAVLERRE